MIVIEGIMRIPPARLEEARSVMEQMILASRAEPGCLDYAYSVDVLDPGLIRVSERWVSRDALAAHFKTAHMATWRSFFPQLGITDRSLRLYEAESEPI
ncbi:putative quinol monooxygenase [Hyphomonas sp.]|jgi:quinol monooxygenase YgiN|uniref:putative quinol monooxygenase n=1 Tax=Hyphomonas sp. TaxID=87 RepID=UPI0039E6065B